jgi:hypothetical protein
MIQDFGTITLNLHVRHAIIDETSDTLYALFENGAVEGGPHLLTSPE